MVLSMGGLPHLSFPRKWESRLVSAKTGNHKKQLDSRLRKKPWIPAGVYPGENRGRSDNMEIGFEF